MKDIILHSNINSYNSYTQFIAMHTFNKFYVGIGILLILISICSIIYNLKTKGRIIVNSGYDFPDYTIYILSIVILIISVFCYNDTYSVGKALGYL